MTKKRRLGEYGDKRDFRRTSEPEGGRSRPSRGGPRFVIQKHDARKLHYDFRLEVEGVLKSWAVPKGPSTDPRDRRLAVSTEDHPLAYADFEGVIPKGQYGAGTVLIWDRGTYRNLRDEDGDKSVSDGLKDGHLAVWLNGEKIRGGYALTRMDRRGKKNWLLVKMDDEEADARRKPVSTEPKSVLSGRDLDAIRSQGVDEVRGKRSERRKR